jgi:hypothetical protein
MTLVISAAIFKKPLTWVIISLLVIGIGGSIYWLTQRKSASPLDALLAPTNTNLGTTNTSGNEAQKLIEEVGKLIKLPENEVPTIATITDVTQLPQDQEFFKQVQNGDQVLVYTQAKKVILYRPSLKKIIDVQQITINNTTPTPGVQSATPSANLAPSATPTLVPPTPTASINITPTSPPEF